MGALITLLPQISALINNPAVAAMLPLIQQLLSQVGTAQFPGVDPNKAPAAGAALFDLNSVKWVQAALGLEADGIYGDATKAAVKAFQGAHGLVVDGWAGSLTQDALRTSILPKTSA